MFIKFVKKFIFLSHFQNERFHNLKFKTCFSLTFSFQIFFDIVESIQNYYSSLSLSNILTSYYYILIGWQFLRITYKLKLKSDTITALSAQLSNFNSLEHNIQWIWHQLNFHKLYLIMSTM